jgi:GNAT superfamily N-acetyltransferase
MSAVADHFVYGPIQLADISDCIRIAVANFDEFQQHPEYIQQWFERRIVQNPWQDALPCVGVGVWHNGRLAGFRAMFVQPWWLNGESVTIAFGSNTCVDEQFRGQGLATKLIEHSLEFARFNGTVTAGVITQKAFKKCGFVEIGGSDNDFYRLRVGYRRSWQKRAGKFLGYWLGSLFDINLRLRNVKLHSGGFKFAEVLHCETEFDELWERAKAGYASCLERSSRYLNWRLFDFPTCPLRLFALRDAAGKLRAYAIWHQQGFGDAISMAVLRDVFYPLDDEPALQALLYYLFAYWRENGISWGSLEVASPQLTSLFRSLGYEAVPSRGNRYLIYRQPPLADNILQNWYRSGIDGDYFDHPL